MFVGVCMWFKISIHHGRVPRPECIRYIQQVSRQALALREGYAVEGSHWSIVQAVPVQ